MGHAKLDSYEQQPTPENQHFRVSHSQPTLFFQPQSQPPPKQSRQRLSYSPQAQAHTQMPSRNQLQQLALQTNTFETCMPQPGAQQAPTTTLAQPEPLQPQLPRQDINVMSIDSKKRADPETSGLNLQIPQYPDYRPSQPDRELMPLLLEGKSYPTLEAVRKAVLTYCTSVDCAIVIGRSTKTRRGLKKVLLVCDRAGRPPNNASAQHGKRRRSRKCHCPFSFLAIEGLNQWTIRPRPDEKHLQHNHGGSANPPYRLATKQLDTKMIPAITQTHESDGSAPKNLQRLQNEISDPQPQGKAIYNAPEVIDWYLANPRQAPSALQSSPAVKITQSHKVLSKLRAQLTKAKGDLKKLGKEKDQEIGSLKEEIKEKDKIIAKFEMFIDICNQEIMS